MRLSRLGCLLLIASMFAGCVHSRPPLSAEIQAQLGTIGVETAGNPTGFSAGSRPAGWVEGAGFGLARGVLLVPAAIIVGAAGGAAGGGIGAVFMGALAGTLAVAWLPFSILGGGLTADSPEAVAYAEGAIDRAWTGMSATISAPGELVRLGSAQTRRSFVFLGRDSSRRNVDSLLEMKMKVEFSGGGMFDNLWSANPALELSVTFQTRLTSAKDGRVLDRREIRVADPKSRTFADWGRANASAFRASLPRLIRTAAQQAVHELFMGPESKKELAHGVAR